MNNILILIALFTATTLTSQVIDMEGDNTFAVVIGISDYQNPSIPDLRFADRDAKAFADYLRSDAGGNVPEEHLMLLINEKATLAQMAAAFDWLMTESGEDDMAIIYFSGHGDVETKTHSQLGYLLNWDAPSRAYMARAFAVFYLQEIVATLSLNNKSKVLLVTDACRAGNLAGKGISGAQLTNANLAKTFANEIKILSCQPNEFSYEGEQWGGGRGVFSYYLLNGLYGQADNNSDAMVTLLEIGRFLEDHVSSDIAPDSQLPMAIGPRTEVIAYVNQSSDENPQSDESGDLLASSKKISRSPQAAADKIPPELKGIHEAFLNCVEKNFDYSTADSLSGLLLSSPSLANFYPDYKRKFAAAIQDEVNQALNALLKSDPYEVNNFIFHPEKYIHYPQYLQRSIDLVGEDNLITPSLKVKKLYFEAYNIFRSLSESDKFEKPVRDSLRRSAHMLIEQALEIEPTAAWLHYANGFFYGLRTPSQIDSVLKYSLEAIRLSPRWLLPMLTIASEYKENLYNFSKAEEWLQKAKQIDPESFIVAERLAWLYLTIGPKEKAMEMSDKMIELRPDLFNGYAAKGGCYYQYFDFEMAESFYNKALGISNDPTNWVNFYLIYVEMATRKTPQAKSRFENLITDERTPYWMAANYYTWYAKGLINFTHNLSEADALLDSAFQRRHIVLDKIELLVWKAKSKFLQNQLKEAKILLDEAVSNDSLSISAFILAYSLLGELEAIAGNDQAAEAYFKKGADYWGDDFFKEEALYRYGVFLLNKNRLEEAEKQFQLCQYITNNHGFMGEYGLAMVNAKLGKTDIAIYELEKALERYYPHLDTILAEPVFQEIRQTEQFNELIKEYFGQN